MLLIWAAFALPRRCNFRSAPSGRRTRDFPVSLSVMLFSIGAVICAMSFVRTPEPVEFGGQAWAVVVTAGAFVL